MSEARAALVAIEAVTRPMGDVARRKSACHLFAMRVLPGPHLSLLISLPLLASLGACGGGGADAPQDSGVDSAVLAPCTGGASGTVAHGGFDSRVRYQTSSVPYGSTCVSETQTRTCTDGQWSLFDGTYTEPTCAPDPGSCTGTATRCETFAETPCASQSGCSWGAGCNWIIEEDFTYDCSAWNSSMSTCMSVSDCTWTGSACTGGTHDCPGHTKPQCDAIYAQGIYCQWDTTLCVGEPSACSSFDTVGACNAQAGCTWQ